VGKHAAPEGSAVHPIVADALARRAETAADGHGEPTSAGRSGPVGWPAPPAPGGGGLGWPARDRTDAHPAVPPAAEPPAAQRGWRRFFRLRAAA
jgi:hypothetical protein